MKNNIKKIVVGIRIALLSSILSSCNYLDVVPDNIATIDHAFSDRAHAESYLYGCYSFLPTFSTPNHSPVFFGGDEAWLFNEVNTSVLNIRGWRIARGEQNTNTPIFNYWASNQDGFSKDGGISMFTAIRDVNIFLEEIHKPGDLTINERNQWIAEAKFLKAFFHFWLLRCYGPIPIIDTNLPISAETEEVQVYREPVDSVANYIARLLDEAIVDLPEVSPNFISEMGRATKSIAAAVKAQTLVLAASPLFNGNTYYDNLGTTDSRGVEIFHTGGYKSEKWVLAATAIESAIAYAESAGHVLYDFRTSSEAAFVHQPTIHAMQSRGAATDHWNPEIIWGQLPRDNPDLIQRMSFPPFTEANKSVNLLMSYAPPLHIVEQFYSRNGVPLEEDEDWQEKDWYGLRTASPSDEGHKYYIQDNFQTVNLHYDREARFYGAISFDGSLYYANGAFDDTRLSPTLFRHGTLGGFVYDRHSATGYLQRKMININTSMAEAATAPVYFRYAFPVIRLADLYLLYAEALNEVKAQPDEEVYYYIDVIRERSGLEGVVDSWNAHAVVSKKDKPRTKEGLREIIRRERLIELAFEGSRFWDLRRWKLAEHYLNEPIRGLNIYGETANEFYRQVTLYQTNFRQKDYLWPLRQGNLLRNDKLVQNPGW
ncbi:RagB/SusD family nutrient uptake outer membrane protein [Sphingobacterium corticibacterium]|uniref:RagB/SusD family nutrient uptake outer membrane protein n=1 Tax=Sphingobacterium corticibacterium TaxID=2484746 RepID=A0A4Q6XES5_9SPHI|nr:RagB/SusD family nutrient uptake outer membrane protein [Sphingobacterium corticibacterium]RZF58331.1 RagB/SusD family nutrient uptake outer membrane protein [Sphingobacterium corticibacterium]